MSKVINGQYAISQRVSLILLLTSKRVRSTAHGVPTPPPLDNLRDEVNAITRRWSKSFSYLICCFAGRTGWCELPHKGQQAIGRIFYAIAPFKVVLCIITGQCASESTSESHSSGEVEVKSQERCSGPSCRSTYNVYV